jgi:putative transcriptional regulator
MAKKKSIEERLLASARQALEITRGKRAPARAYSLPLLTARQASAVPAREYSADAIARLREQLGLSQAVFAEVLNVSPATVRSWEQEQRTPDGAAVRMLQIAEDHPEVIRELLQVGQLGRSRETPTRVGVISEPRARASAGRAYGVSHYLRREGKAEEPRGTAARHLASKRGVSRSGRGSRPTAGGSRRGPQRS